MEGSYSDTARITLIKTDPLYSISCQASYIITPYSNLIVSNTAVGSVTSLTGELSFSVPDSVLQVPYFDLCGNVSIDEFNINAQINIYPNPAKNNFTIETASTDKQTLQIFDVNGKLVLTQTIN